MRRFFDIVFSASILAAMLPVLLVVAILVRFKLGSPILFKQARMGKDGRTFTIYKFRSMTDEKNADGELLPDQWRLTRFGRFLRTWSLDEIPGFLNVLNGDMSVVGPRPQDVEFMKKCTPCQLRRHEVKPGITGWAQVNGRNTISWEERFELDVWYVDNKSLWLDLKIIYLTVFTVLLRRGISAKGHATMPEFNGSDNAPLSIQKSAS